MPPFWAPWGLPLLWCLPVHHDADFCPLLIYCLGAGAAYGTAKAGLGIIQVGIIKPELVIRSSLPIIMAGIVGLYGVITDIVIIFGSKNIHKCLALISHWRDM